MGELWSDIAGWEGIYQVSNLGRIRSLDRSITYPSGRVMRWKSTILKQSKGGSGYRQVLLANGDSRPIRQTHRLVLEAFVGPAPEKHVACHNDGNKDNNALSNLRWDTQSNNLLDKVNHGTSDRGSANAMSILTEAEVRLIKERLKSGGRGIGRALAKEFGVGTSTISAIAVGKRWGWLT